MAETETTPVPATTKVATVSSLSTAGGLGVLVVLWNTVWPSINNQPVFDAVRELEKRQAAIEARLDDLDESMQLVLQERTGGRGDVRRVWPEQDPPTR